MIDKNIKYMYMYIFTMIGYLKFTGWISGKTHDLLSIRLCFHISLKKLFSFPYSRYENVTYKLNNFIPCHRARFTICINFIFPERFWLSFRHGSGWCTCNCQQFARSTLVCGRYCHFFGSYHEFKEGFRMYGPWRETRVLGSQVRLDNFGRVKD